MDSDNKQESVSLMPEESALLAEINGAMAELQQQARGALMLMIRQHKKTGNWRLNDKGTALVRAE